MSTISRIVSVALLAIVTGACVWSADADRTSSILLRKVGSIPVRSGQQIVSEDRSITLFGEATNAADKDVVTLAKRSDEELWTVFATTITEPGGLFHATGIQLPRIGEYELVTGVFRPGEFKVGERLQRSRWESASRTISERVSLFVKGVSTPPQQALVAIVSIADRAVSKQKVNPVPPSADIEVAITGQTSPVFVYIALHPPNSDSALIIGPAARQPATGNFLLQGVPFDVPGNPLQGRLHLVAIAAPRQVRTGPVSWEAMRTWDAYSSSTIEVITDAKAPPIDPLRIPFVALTRIGNHEFGLGQKSGQPSRRTPVAPVKNGDFAEASLYERLPEEASLYIGTRYAGSDLWLLQGPANRHGAPTPDSRSTSPVVTFLWPSVRFERPASIDREDEPSPFEVIIVVSSQMLPNWWVEPTFLSSRSIDSVSEILRVQAEGVAAVSIPRMAISQVGADDADEEGELTVRAPRSVHIAVPKDFPRWLKVYVGRHKEGADTWSFVETLRADDSRIAPEIRFTNPHPQEGARFQLVAIATSGSLPGSELRYEEFLHHAVSTSKPIAVRYSNGWIQGIKRRFFSLPEEADPPVIQQAAFLGASASSPSANGTPAPPSTSSLAASAAAFVILVLLIVLAIAAALFMIERRFKVVSEFSRHAANTLANLRAESKKTFVIPEKLEPAHFLLGVAMLVLALYVINTYYVRLLAEVAHKVTGLEHKESLGLALWLIIIVGMLGIIIDLAFKFAKEESPHAVLFKWVFRVSLVAALVLWVFEGGLYFSSFAADAEGIVAPLGGIVFFLIGLAETMIFFMITVLTLPTLGWLVVHLALLPIYLAELAFRVMEVFLRAIPRRESGPVGKLGSSQLGTEPTEPLPAATA